MLKSDHQREPDEERQGGGKSKKKDNSHLLGYLPNTYSDQARPGQSKAEVTSWECTQVF